MHIATTLAGFAALAPTTLAQPCDFDAADARVEQMLADFPDLLDGAGLLVGRADGTILHEAYFGTYDASTTVSLASASKLVSATAIATLVDADLLDPAAPLRELLPDLFAPELVGPVKSSLTVDQMYSMTSGLPGGTGAGSVLGDLDITMEDAVAEIACCVPLASLPGTDLRYGGYGMHVAGFAAARVSGAEFDDFFDAALNAPLGTAITWDGLGATRNFRPSGGGASNLRDYGRVLELLLNRGSIEGGPSLLAPATVEWMFVERTVGLPPADVPPTVVGTGFGYAFGMWVEARDGAGAATVLSSPGAFGFTPWLDLADGYYGIVMVEGSNSILDPEIDAIRALVDQAVAEGCPGCAGDFNANGVVGLGDLNLLLTRWGQPGFTDLDGSGATDVADLNVVLRQWGACPST